MEPEWSLGTGLTSPSHKELGHIQVPSRKTAEGIEEQSPLSAGLCCLRTKQKFQPLHEEFPQQLPTPARGGFRTGAPAVWAMVRSQGSISAGSKSLFFWWDTVNTTNLFSFPKSLGKIFLRSCYCRRAQQQTSAQHTSAIGWDEKGSTRTSFWKCMFKSRRQTHLKSLLNSSERSSLQSAPRWISYIAAHQSLLVPSASDKSSKIKLLSHHTLQCNTIKLVTWHYSWAGLPHNVKSKDTENKHREAKNYTEYHSALV